MSFLPISRKEIEERGWDQVDFVLVSGDAYIDHPSFGTAIIGRVLESFGYKVAILAQPDYKKASEFKKFGKPRLGFLVTAGNIDSMVNHYTVAKKNVKKIFIHRMVKWVYGQIEQQLFILNYVR
ncbi:radical SAM protein [Haloplasma contractile SSD-17B]|uniref:Radical SAM protein n=1 Tax=Haloplasma contractile SSD-17B TaxID=1033810 RepID=U2ECX8_9MOLU|nr:radical SAM protein [Haloplasma contractile SSD-17B]